MTTTSPTALNLGAGSVPGLGELAALDVNDALGALGGSVHGLDGAGAARRLEVLGPNAIRSHRVRPFATADCVDTMLPQWGDRLAGLDVFLYTHCQAMEQSLRVD